MMERACPGSSAAVSGDCRRKSGLAGERVAMGRHPQQPAALQSGSIVELSNTPPSSTPPMDHSLDGDTDTSGMFIEWRAETPTSRPPPYAEQGGFTILDALNQSQKGASGRLAQILRSQMDLLEALAAQGKLERSTMVQVSRDMLTSLGIQTDDNLMCSSIPMTRRTARWLLHAMRRLKRMARQPTKVGRWLRLHPNRLAVRARAVGQRCAFTRYDH